MIQKSIHRLLMTGFVAFISSLSLMAQHKVEVVPFGDMDQWVDRQIKESSIIGGNTKNVYAIGPTSVIKGDQVYKNMGGSPWATSNVMAKVAGITKTNTSVFPEKRGDVSSMKFQEQWLASCDEAEKEVIYQSAYKAYVFAGKCTAVLLLVTMFAQLLFNTGILAIIVVGIMYLILSMTYCKSCVDLKKAKIQR